MGITKGEVFGGQGLLRGGIQSTIQRRSEKFQEQKQEQLEKEYIEAEKYQERLSKGEITNTNQIPQNLRKYFNFNEITKEVKTSLSNTINEARNKVSSLEKDYNRRLDQLRDWRDNAKKRASRDERDSINETYKKELADLRKDYKPQIAYNKEIIKKLSTKINEMDGGELFSEEYAISYAKAYAEYEERKIENDYSEQYREALNKEVDRYLSEIEKNKIKLEDVPYNLRKKVSDRIISIVPGDKPIYDSDGKLVGVESAALQQSTADFDYYKKATKEIINNQPNMGELPVSTIPSTWYSFERYQKLDKTPELFKSTVKKVELKRDSFKDYYKKNDFTDKQAEILASESLKSNKVFTGKEAERIINNNAIKEQWKNKLNNLGSSLVKLGVSLPFFKVDQSSQFEDLREFGDNLLDSTNQILQNIGYAIDTGTYKANDLKVVRDLKAVLDSSGKGLDSFYKKTLENPEVPPEIKRDIAIFSGSLRAVNENIKNKEKALSESVRIGELSPTGKIAPIAIDVALDFAIPGKGAVDIALLLNSIVPKKEDFQLLTKTINEKGFKKTVEELGPKIKEDVINFFTNKEQVKEIKDIREENLKEIAKVEKGIRDGIYDNSAGNSYINELKNQNKELGYYEKSLNQNNLVNIGTIAFMALATSATLYNKIKGKKAYLSYDNAVDAAKRYNNLEAGKPIDNTGKGITAVIDDMQINKNQLDNIKKQTGIQEIKGIGIDDISDIRVSTKSLEFRGPQSIKKVSGVNKKLKYEYYITTNPKNYFQNYIDVSIRLKNGRTMGLSVVSKSPKPVPRFRNLDNIIKYGTNKKYYLTGLMNDAQTLAGVEFTRRAGRTKVEDYYFGRTKESGVSQVRRKSEISTNIEKRIKEIENMTEAQRAKLERRTGKNYLDLIEELRGKLTPEDYWGMGVKAVDVKRNYVKELSIDKLKKIKNPKYKTFTDKMMRDPYLSDTLGFHNPKTGEIFIRKGLTKQQFQRVLMHERGHWYDNGGYIKKNLSPLEAQTFIQGGVDKLYREYGVRALRKTNKAQRLVDRLLKRGYKITQIRNEIIAEAYDGRPIYEAVKIREISGPLRVRDNFGFDMRASLNVKPFYEKVKRYNVNIDLGNFNFVAKSNIDNLSKTIPRGKKTISFRTLENISKRAGDAIQNGKNTLLISPETLNKLSLEDFGRIQSSIASVSMPKPSFKDFTTKTKKFSSEISKKITTNNNLLRAVTTSVNRIRSDLSGAYFTPLSKERLETLSKETNKLKNNSKVATNSLEKIKSSLVSEIKSIEEVLSSVSQISQVSQLNLQLANLTNKLSTINQVISMYKVPTSTFKYIDTTIKNMMPKAPKKKAEIKEAGIGGGNLFDIYTRKAGKDIKISSKKTAKEAKSELFESLDKTLRASGFIKRGSKKLKIGDLPFGFTKSKVDPFRVVEKRSKRLSSKSEVSAIKKAKRAKQKTAEEYWLR